MASTKGPSPLRRFFALLKPDRKDIIYIYVYAVLIGILALVGPLGVQAVINLIAGGEFNASLVILVAVVTGAAVLVGALKIMQYVIAETLQRRLFSKASFEFAYRLPRIKLAELKDHYPPELVNRFFDVLTVQKGLPKILLDLSGAVMQILFGLVLLSLYHPFFAAFGGALLLILFLILRLMAPAGLSTSLMESKYKYKVAGWLEDIARASNTFKLAGGERLTMRRTNDLLSGYLDARAAHFKVLLYHYFGLIAFQALVTAFFLLLGGKLVIDNQINIGQFVAAEIVILLIIGSAEKLIFTLDVVYDTLTGVEKIATVTDLEQDVQWALSVAQLSSWVTEQPEGYDTELVAEGLNVPGSIRVRLLLARAIVRRPRLLVLGNLLDRLEPTTRRKIVTDITDERQQWTLVILSNEPEVAMACDRVLLLRRGGLLFDGTPAAALANEATKEIWSTSTTSY